jgi:F0F1-type ATP synthase assembly protein I
MRPFRTVLLWQVIAIAVLSLFAAIPWGKDGALSAALGGSVNVAAGWAYGWMVSRRKAGTAGEALRTLFRAEAVKITVIVLMLSLALTHYRAIVHAAFFGSFVVTVVIFAAAIAVRDKDEGNMPRASGQQ